MTVDTQQFVYRVVALTMPLAIFLSFIGVTVVALTHDGTAIQMMFDFFNTTIKLAIPASGVLGAMHLWTTNSGGSAPVAAPPVEMSSATGEGTAGA